MAWLLNPYFVLSFCFILSYSATFLGWSDLFGDLNEVTNAIYLSVALFFFCLSLLTYDKYKKNTIFKKICISPSDNLFIFLIIGFFILELFYSGSLPFLLDNYSDILDSKFGIPILHGFFISYISYKSLYFYYVYLSTKNLKYLLFILCINLIIFLLMRRGLLVFNLLAYTFMYIIYSLSDFGNIKFIKIKIILISITTLLFFGLIGNLRLGDNSGDYILSVGKASQKFFDSGVPKEFFYGYMYLSSPVNIFDINVTSVNQESFVGFVYKNILPDFLAKRFIAPDDDLVVQTSSGFNVGGLFLIPFQHAGFMGIFYIIFYYLALSLLVLRALLKKKKRSIIALCLFLSLSSLLTFSNLLNAGGYILQLFMALFFFDFKRHFFVVR